jgi:hypothetical protein
MVLERHEPASASLLSDLRSDKGMDWMPTSMWLSYLKVDALPSTLDYDLAVDATGADRPSPLAAGIGLRPGVGSVTPVGSTTASRGRLVPVTIVGGVAVVALAGFGGGLVARRRRRATTT